MTNNQNAAKGKTRLTTSEKKLAADGIGNLRVLYVDVNARFLNPTRNVLPLAFKSACDTVFFGPGYVPSAVIKRGLDAFIDTHGPFDFAVITEHMMYRDETEQLPRTLTLRRSYAVDFPWADLLEAPRIRRAFNKLACPRIVSLQETDFYPWTNFHTERISMCADYYLVWNTEFRKRIEELPNLGYESFAERATDLWIDYLDQKTDQTISCVHMVGENEFEFLPFSSRKRVWSVPGDQYHARAVARRGIRDMDKRARLPSNIHKKLFLRYGALKNRVGIALANAMFAREIAQSKYAFTCGSGLGYPIRKFFEIPALGSVLVCEPCNGFEHLGFRHLDNAITCDASDIGDVHAYLEENPEEAQAIARRGQELVWNLHRSGARGQQIRQALEAIRAGSFRGSRWNKGRFEVLAEGNGRQPPEDVAANAANSAATHE